MTTPAAPAAVAPLHSALRPPRLDAKVWDRYFFTGLGLYFLAVMAAGFAPTFYLRPVTAAPLPAYIVWHGVLATLWIAFFLSQAGLIATHHRKLHATMGLAALPLALAVAATGWIVLMRLHVNQPHLPLWAIFANVTNLGCLLVCVTLGLLYRRRADYHKRLMAFAVIPFMGPAAARFGPEHSGILPALAVPAIALGPLFALMAYDWLSRRSVHRVSWIGFSALFGFGILGAFLATFPAVQRFMRQLAGLFV